MKYLPLIFLAFALAGCGNKQAKLMPLHEKAVWTYQAEPGLQNETVDLTVTGQVPVDDVKGYQLSSQWGDSKLAWRGTTLIASQLGGTKYEPPLPLYVNLPKDAKTEWQGNVIVAGKSKKASAILGIQLNEARIGSQELPATESIINLTIGPDKIEILTWFVEDYGIARQEQRKNGILVNRLTYLSGP